ncbi:MAG: DJ-1/PfpI family protein [Pseudomonadota bacterium]
MERKRVGIVLFQNVEVLDFCGPFEVFSITRNDEDKRFEEPSPFEVKLVAEHEGTIVTTGGMRVTPDYTFETCPKLDILVVPGGWGTFKERDNPVMLDWLRRRASEVEILSSVCTGSILLGLAGLLDGHRATTHWRFLDTMRAGLPRVTVEYGEHVVEDGSILTSAGVSAGIDLSLKIVARYCGENIARVTSQAMEYPYPDRNDRRVQL